MAAAAAKNYGQNVSVTVKGDIVTVTFDASQAETSLREGKKMLRVASTGGFVELENGVRLSLNAGKYPER